MGAKESKSSCINYEEAIKRVSDSELRRIKEAFKKSSGPNGTYLSESAFQQDVLCESVPTIVAEWLYTACGGTSKGITFKDLFCGLVLLTRGTEDEKIRFLWNLYSNDSGNYILKSDYTKALKLETNLYPNDENRSLINTSLVLSLFSLSDRVDFKQFRDWIIKHKKSTILSKWLLIDGCMQLPTELETPTFYQSLAGVTHLEEQDIGDLEKEFWNLKNSSITGQLDLETLGPLISPPIPKTALIGLFNAFDENRDGHIDFKELCCGVSAACRGPNVERSKFCFKVFDIDRDGVLNYNEVKSMIDVLLFVAKESRNANNYKNIARNQVINDLLKFTRNDINSSIEIDIPLEQNSDNNDVECILTQEDFMMWNVDSSLNLVQPFLDLYFEVCHIVFGLRPQCKHLEFEIVRGWLSREERRGYMIGQFWYLISKDWWNSWCQYTQNYSSIPCAYCKNSLTNLSANRQISGVDEAMVCDESFTSNSSESMGDLLATTDSSSLGSGSSGISCGNHQQNSRPGPIDNTNLITPNTFKNVRVLTGEGGHLKKDTPLVQRHDFELIPKSLWKALSRWYGDTLPLPRQVIQPPNSPDVELELYPLNLQILLHQNVTPSSHSLSSWSAVSGGYSAITPGGGYTAISAIPNALHPPKRYLAYTAAFSRLATIKLVGEFLCEQLKLKPENIRLWHVISSNLSSCEDISILLEEDNATLQELNIRDRDKILLEIRNKDLTWPEELGSLSLNQGTNLDRRPTSASVQSLHAPGATGLHNLGNTCFMNAALQVLFNTQPLTQYFRKNMHLYELNMTNKLGTKGQLATRYGELLKEIWTATTRSVAPLKLRFCVTKHAPQFAGGGQHDCQELLEWLLDALHEDLNRVTEKPYTELKDSDGRPDEIVAAEAWALHHSRNQSIVIDLFYGQLKSKVSCLCCGRESVRFDPFSLLSLPLPVENFIYFEILVILLDGSLPIKYGCKINSDSKYIDLKRKLATLCHLNPYLMLFCELNNSQIKCILPDGQKIKLQTATELYCYQLPEDGDETRSRTSSILGVNIEKGLKDIQRNPESSTMQQTQLQPQQQQLSVSSSSTSTSVLQQSSQQQQQQTTNSNNNINNNNYCNNNNNSKNMSFYNPKINYDNVMIRHNNDNNSIIVNGMIGGDDNSMIVECHRPTITTTAITATTAITTTTSSSKQSSEISTSPENTFVNPNRKRISTMNLLNDNNTQSSNNSSDEHDSNIEKLSSYIGGGGGGGVGGGNGIDVINDGNGIGIGGINRCIDEINYDNYYDENCGDDVINIYDNDNDYGNGSSIITTDEEEINRLDCPCRTKNNLMNNKKNFNYNDDNTEKLNHIDYDLINNHHSSSLPQQIIIQKNFENFQRINTETIVTTTTTTETTNNFNINHNININNNNDNMNSINNNNNNYNNNNNSASMIPGRFLIAVHRKLTRQDTYFLSHHKTRSNLFGVPLLIPCYENGTNKDVYCAVWMQVSRLLSPLPPTADQANHAADCDDSLGYDFPFTLRAVTNDGRMCALCPWSNFCRGCEIPCNDDLLLQSRLISSSSNNSSNSSTPTLSHRFSSSLPNLETSKQNSNFFSSNRNLSAINIAIDWDPTALHLRYQSTREKLWTEHESLTICRRQQIEPVDLNHCLRSFTSEEKLEQWYHCSHCKSKKPATKKLQIWRLPPILIIHLKRFNFVNDKWVKSQKVVNFPFENFDPTPYLASVPQETILRHKELLELKSNNNKNITCNNEMLNHIVGVGDGNIENLCLNDKKMMIMMKNNESEYHNYFNNKPTTTMITTTTIETTEECEKIDNNDDTKDKINSNELINYQKVVSAVTENNYDNNQKNHFDNKEQYEKFITSTSSTATETTTTTTTMINTTIPSTSNSTMTTPTIQQTSSASCDATNTTTTTRKLSNAKLEKRKRLISTSLTRTPVIDGHFKDFHHHRLKDGVDHLDLKYNLYAVVSHSGMLNGGHYISYAANPNGSWYCYNDSSCREIPNRPNIDPSSAYLLFYERNGLNYEPYLPNIDGRTLPNGGNASIELDDSDNDLKKMCTIS